MSLELSDELFITEPPGKSRVEVHESKIFKVGQQAGDPEKSQHNSIQVQKHSGGRILSSLGRTVLNSIQAHTHYET